MIVLKEFKKEVPPRVLDFLVQHEFQLVDQVYDPEYFGNFVVVFKANHIGIRFIRDKSELFVELASARLKEWYKLADVVTFLAHADHQQIVPSYEYLELVDQFILNYDRIVGVVGNFWGRMSLNWYLKRRRRIKEKKINLSRGTFNI